MAEHYLLGLDVGSSSVKASLVCAETGVCAASAFFPETEERIVSVQPGWAEQDPAWWWQNVQRATRATLERSGVGAGQVMAVGISYQMHGLVCVDKAGEPLRPAIIWCDSRAVPYGRRAFEALGADVCLSRLLGSPGNFTAAKLAWVKEQEPDIFRRIHRIMLPGDYIALRLTGAACTTVSGLSEAMLWDYSAEAPAWFLMDYYGFPAELLPPLVPTFGEQGRLTAEAAALLGLQEGTPVTYRAGDQPNNALSLGVLSAGDIASTAGTSGVVYGVSDRVACDAQSRVNVFAHVNHSSAAKRLGILLCVNGTGILNAWLHRNAAADLSYAQMNDLAAQAPAGSDGLSVLPFGNGAERLLADRETGCSVQGLDFNRHNRSHLLRAAQEGIAFAFKHGIDIMASMGMPVQTIHAGHANMFLSPVFRQTLADITGASILLCDTDGAAGAAKGAGIGLGYYSTPEEAFRTLQCIDTITPRDNAPLREAYDLWENRLKNNLQIK